MVYIIFSNFKCILNKILLFDLAEPKGQITTFLSSTVGFTNKQESQDADMIQRDEKVTKAYVSVCPSEIKYFRIGVHKSYRVDLIQLNPRMPSFFKLEDV